MDSHLYKYGFTYIKKAVLCFSFQTLPSIMVAVVKANISDRKSLNIQFIGQLFFLIL